ILSGRYPTEHGVRDNAGFRFPPRGETLATRLRAAGYRTGAFVSAFPLASRFGLAAGFDVYDDSFVDAEARPAFLAQERPRAGTGGGGGGPGPGGARRGRAPGPVPPGPPSRSRPPRTGPPSRSLLSCTATRTRPKSRRPTRPWVRSWSRSSPRETGAGRSSS